MSSADGLRLAFIKASAATALVLSQTSVASCWSGQINTAPVAWGPAKSSWGQHNQSVRRDSSADTPFLRVALQRGGIDPGSMRQRGLPRSGSGFKVAVIAGGEESASLTYRLRFAPGFDFVRGGKLPGLFGGTGPSGGAIPDGTDGFSFRLMWREMGQGEVYAYLPTSKIWGTSLLARRFRFVPGVWHSIRQEVVLNTPGISNGVLRLWFDGELAGEAKELRMRDTKTLQLDGLFFDVFFGGGDDSWAATSDTYIDFADFSVAAPAWTACDRRH